MDRDECPVKEECPEGMVYKECGTACPTTCDNKDDDVSCITVCVPGTHLDTTSEFTVLNPTVAFLADNKTFSSLAFEELL